MAQELTISAGARVKIRSPWGVFFLALVTLGIYYLVWYYKINRELRDFGIGTSPVTSVLAISIGGLIIVPPFVSMWNTLGRISEAEERAGSPTTRRAAGCRRGGSRRSTCSATGCSRSV